MECACGNIDPRQRGFVSNLGKSGQEIVAAGVQQAVFGQGAGGDQTHDIAFDDGLVAALFGFGGALHLFADCDAEPFADEGQQIPFGGMNGNAAHGDVLVIVFAAFGQRDIQRFGRGHSIVKEHLVEIAHAIEQHRVWVCCLDFEILRHHRRDVCHLVPHFRSRHS